MALGAAPIVSNAPIMFPWPGASADLDFVRRQYFWNGATRTEANFTTLVLNGATWEARGLNISTATANPNITITLATLAIAMPPCVYAFGGYFLSTPGSNKFAFTIDDATANERFLVMLQSTPAVSMQTADGGVTQSTQNPGAIGSGTNRFGIAYSAQLNEVLAAGQGVGAASDTAATMPTVTTLRLGCSTAATSFMPGILSRLVIFAAVKTQADINQLSTQMRDTP